MNGTEIEVSRSANRVTLLLSTDSQFRTVRRSCRQLGGDVLNLGTYGLRVEFNDTDTASAFVELLTLSGALGVIEHADGTPSVYRTDGHGTATVHT